MTGGGDRITLGEWQQKVSGGLPEIHRDGDTCTVTFYWQDPAGTAQTSPIRRVWIYITGVTDHHQQMMPQSLQRLDGSDIWRWQVQLSARWRGSYCFIPSCREDDFSAAALQTPPDRQALREGWRKLLGQAIADPLNKDGRWQGGRGHPVSALHLPDAPLQPGWQPGSAASFTPATSLQWRSQRLGNQRQVWVFTTGEEQPEKRPLAILLDGCFWAEQQPVWSALQTETDNGHLPPAVYLLIDAINTESRSRELTCNPDFWMAVQDELLPLLSRDNVWRDDPATTVVAGQSFGGLSALYAALHWPQRFGCVLSQSGSFWWPHRQGQEQSGLLAEQVSQGVGEGCELRIFMEAGVREPLILQANQRLLPLLQKSHPSLIYRQFEGGHDALCWRGGLTDGLAALWQTVRP
ncbi:enterochelin esterase [Pantoea sp. BAV 3049]|uniref:enterochelin esterase n=1 Tax=Pantoea sp. BAV 3049 TaxID=2654188 RepID=UPI00131BD022|nr:enterochelin esterase [Pantoea sp. BAV 3049]